jgi:hypothetical protein
MILIPKTIQHLDPRLEPPSVSPKPPSLSHIPSAPMNSGDEMNLEPPVTTVAASELHLGKRAREKNFTGVPSGKLERLKGVVKPLQRRPSSPSSVVGG